jgi:phosphopantothenoylcysteine decarboxylase/phosphopantothenate--cysteine ligase
MQNRQIIVGITGGIAAYKAAELVRLLQGAGASVRVVMTTAATEFITPLTLQALSGNPVHLDLLDTEAEAGMGHIELARWADAVVVAPASANFIARLSQGRADDLLTTLCLATTAPVVVAPAMNQAMWKNPATRDNCKLLRERQIGVIGPAEGQQACGDTGPGRMLEPTELLIEVDALFSTGKLSGKRVVITAGPTREAIDPVRYLTNHSSGKMGYALARAAADAGAETVLISGPVDIPAPERVTLVPVISAIEMHGEALKQADNCDIFIAAAAVADYRPETVADKKIKKGSEETLRLDLIKNPDIIADVGQQFPGVFRVGFAAETNDLELHARNKLERKDLQMVIANDVSDDSIGFQSDQNAVTVFSRNHQTSRFEPTRKTLLAQKLIELISSQFEERAT